MSTTEVGEGRHQQRSRTRKALIEAAADLLDAGEDPTLEQVAEAAAVSRATAYRYFSSIDILMAETVVASALVDPGVVVDDTADLSHRVRSAVTGAAVPLAANEVAAHVLARSIAERWLATAGDDDGDVVRPRRRLLYIDRAIGRAADELGPEVTARLRSALALVTGLEAVLSARDVAGLDVDETMATLEWAADALVAKAVTEAERD